MLWIFVVSIASSIDIGGMMVGIRLDSIDLPEPGGTIMMMLFLQAIMPSAIGRSKLGPSFLMSAGARFTVVRPRGQKYPLLEIAVVTRSLLSLTAASGKPTTTMTGLPPAALTSISTS